MTLSLTTLSEIILFEMTPKIRRLHFQHNDIHHNYIRHNGKVSLCWVSFMLSVIYAKCHLWPLCRVSLWWMSLCWVSWLTKIKLNNTSLLVTIQPNMLTVVIPSVVILSVLAPNFFHEKGKSCKKHWHVLHWNTSSSSLGGTTYLSRT